MAFHIDRSNGQNYAENIVDPLLLFDNGTWTTAGGTGTVLLNSDSVFVGDSSLRLENNAPTADYTASNSVQSTLISVTGDYDISWYCLKTIAEEIVNGEVLIFKNAALLARETFGVGNLDPVFDNNNTWVRFQAGVSFQFNSGDVITFQFKVAPSTTVQPTTVLFFDGFMVSAKGRLNKIVPEYNKPTMATLEDIVNNLNETHGWANYDDGETAPANQEVTTVASKLLIDGASSGTNTDYLPLEIRGTSELWDSVNNKMLAISVGDTYTVRLNLEITAKTGLPKILAVIPDIGGAAGITIQIPGAIIPVETSAIPFTLPVELKFFSLATFIANGCQLFLLTDTGTLTIGERAIFIERNYKGNL